MAAPSTDEQSLSPGGTTDDQLVLRPPSRRVERRAIGWWAAQAVAVVLPPVFVLVLLAVLIAPARPWLLLSAAAVGAPGLLTILVMPYWRYRVHRWERTDDAVFTRAGWVRQEWRIAPLSRVQTVDTVRGPLQQMFRLATVTITTASAAGPVKIDGLDHEFARDLAEELTRVTQATPGDAT
ncbi:PH domain-containing protein [Streptomyces sp. Isolate_45]|uniref:PH domain-containing protein n=1 Tax=Streptomyces sp. Isolate_45 TaxID=2950111 RepID=UPI002481DE1F|nr:PH domain-containing protein [Streptomyces sp. Isolate_45]MDA5279601.1 PH domain-containing protein [Streptomyces sp. Isolate_45]